MFIRLEKTHEEGIYLVVDEVDRYMGKIDDMDFTIHCMLDKDSVEMEGYTFFAADKKELEKYCRK